MSWQAAAGASTAAAGAAKDLRPQAGRARPPAGRSPGHPDAGTVPPALVTPTIADHL